MAVFHFSLTQPAVIIVYGINEVLVSKSVGIIDLNIEGDLYVSANSLEVFLGDADTC